MSAAKKGKKSAALSVIQEIPVEQIVPNPEQPRKTFDQGELKKLAASIKENGLINAITVERTEKEDVFILEDGERRLRAHKLAGIKTILAVVRPAGAEAQDRLTRALVANLQRADMNPVEEGQAYLRLHQDFGWKLVKMVRATGVSQPRILNRMAIAKLAPEIQELIINKNLPKDQRAIEALQSIPSTKARIQFAQELSKRPDLTVSGIQRAATKLKEQLAKGGANETTELTRDVAPAIHFGLSKSHVKREAPIWTQLVAKQVAPSWDLVKQAAESACFKCPFYDDPSEGICGQCPAVEQVAQMVRLSHEFKVSN